MDLFPFLCLLGHSPPTSSSSSSPSPSPDWLFSHYWDDAYNYIEFPHLNSLRPYTLPHLRDVLSHRGLNVFEPVSNVFKALECDLLGGLEPRGMRIVTLIVHTANAALLFLLLGLFFRRGHWCRHVLIALVGTFWYIHPLNMEVIGWLSAQGYAISLSLCLLSSICLEVALDVRPVLETVEGQRQTRMLSLSVIFYILACLAKPPAVTLPVVHLIRLALEYHRTSSTAQTQTQRYVYYPAALVASLAATLSLIVTANSSSPTAYKMPRSITSLVLALVKSVYTVCLFACRTLYPVDLRAHYVVPSVFLKYKPTPTAALASLLQPSSEQPTSILLPCLAFALTLLCSLLSSGGAIAFGILAWGCLWAPATGVFPHGWVALGGDRYCYMPNAYLSVGLVAVLLKVTGYDEGREGVQEVGGQGCRKQTSLYRRFRPLRLIMLLVFALPYLALLGGISTKELLKWSSDRLFLEDCVAKDPNDYTCLDYLAEYFGHHEKNDAMGRHYRSLMLEAMPMHELKDYLYKGRTLLFMARQDESCDVFALAHSLYGPSITGMPTPSQAPPPPTEHLAMLLNNFLVCQSVLFMGRFGSAAENAPSAASLEHFLVEIDAILTSPTFAAALTHDSTLQGVKGYLSDHAGRIRGLLRGESMTGFEGSFAW